MMNESAIMDVHGSLPMLRRSAILDAAGRPATVAVRPAGASLSRLRETHGDFGRAGIDAVVTGRHTDEHFASADGRPLSAVLEENLPRLRDWLRYEARNNGDAKGIIDTLVTSVVATGPTLQVNSGDDEIDRVIQEEFAAWAEDLDFEEPDISLADHMAAWIREQPLAGEDFLTWTSDTDAAGPVKLRLQSIIAERVATPWGADLAANIRDGIRFNDRGQKTGYCVYNVHPKDSSLAAIGQAGKYRDVGRDLMSHLFIRSEPGQHRGFPWFSSALPVLSQARRFALAVLSAAETAADLSVIVQTTSDNLAPQPLSSVDSLPIQRNVAMNLPAGWVANQLKPEQPAATLEMYMKELRRQEGRPLGMPYNVAAADSSGHNFASGRMDHQLFKMASLVLRQWTVRRRLKLVLRLWLGEARYVIAALTGLSPVDAMRICRTSQWHFRDFSPQGDPLKEAKATSERLKNGSATYIDVCAEQGLDWEAQMAKETAVRRARLRQIAELRKEAASLQLDENAVADVLGQTPAVKAAAEAEPEEDEEDPQITQREDADEE